MNTFDFIFPDIKKELKRPLGSDYPEHILKAELKKCNYCYDTGIRSYANGPDDYDEDLCDCVYADILVWNAKIKFKTNESVINKKN